MKFNAIYTFLRRDSLNNRSNIHEQQHSNTNTYTYNEKKSILVLIEPTDTIINIASLACNNTSLIILLLRVVILKIQQYVVLTISLGYNGIKKNDFLDEGFTYNNLLQISPNISFYKESFIRTVMNTKFFYH